MNKFGRQFDRRGCNCNQIYAGNFGILKNMMTDQAPGRKFFLSRFNGRF